VVTQSNGSNRDAELLEEGESTAGPSQPNSLNSRLKGFENSDSDGGDDFFATGKDQDFQCTVRVLRCRFLVYSFTRIAFLSYSIDIRAFLIWDKSSLRG